MTANPASFGTIKTGRVPIVATSPALMATDGIPKAERIGTWMLEQLSGIDSRNMSPATAREILELRFTESQQDRLYELSEKARRGSLTAAEHDDIDEYIRVGYLLATLQSKARRALRRAGER